MQTALKLSGSASASTYFTASFTLVVNTRLNVFVIKSVAGSFAGLRAVLCGISATPTAF